MSHGKTDLTQRLQETEGNSTVQQKRSANRIWIECSVFAAVSAYFVLFKLRLGLHEDELGIYAFGMAVVKHEAYVRDLWYVIQFNSFFTAPLIRLYLLLTGSTDGLIYCLRIVFWICQTALAFGWYRVLRKHTDRGFAAAAGIVLYFYVPYMYGFQYRALANWFVVSELVLLISCREKLSYRKDLLLAVCVVLSTLAYVTTAILAAAVTAAYLICLAQKREKFRHLAAFWAVVIALGGGVLTAVIVPIGLKDFFKFLPIAMDDGGHVGNFLPRVVKQTVSMGCIGCAVWTWYRVYYLIRRKIPAASRIVQTDRFTFLTILGITLILILIRPETVTVSRVNYLMIFLFWIAVVVSTSCSLKMGGQHRPAFYIWRREALPPDSSRAECAVADTRHEPVKETDDQSNEQRLFLGFTLCYLVSNILATNQGIAVSGEAAIPGVIYLLYLCSRSRLHLPHTRCLIVLIFAAAGLLLVPVQPNVTRTTVFGYKGAGEAISGGPAKGIVPLDQGICTTLNKWDQVISGNDFAGDCLLIEGTYKEAAYLQCNAASFATNGPSFAEYALAKSDGLLQYWQMNPAKRPTAGLFDTAEAGTAEEFLHTNELGKVLAPAVTDVEEQGRYFILRLNPEAVLK